MKVAALFILTIALACTYQFIQAQSSVVVSRPILSLENSGVQISYDILNSSETDEFSIRMEVRDSTGRMIEAHSLSGDFGETVHGGFNKKIFWDIVADSIFLDEEIFVQVYALAKPRPVVEEETVIIEEPPPVVEDQTSSEEITATSSKTFNRVAIIAQSLALPGLGLSRVNPGQPHWIKGVVGYGCIAGALYFNHKAVTSYDAYKNSGRLEDVDDMYNKAVNQDLTSEVLAFAALGIWVTDLVWNILGTRDLNLSHPSLTHKGLSIGASVEPVSSSPLITLRYTF